MEASRAEAVSDFSVSRGDWLGLRDAACKLPGQACSGGLTKGRFLDTETSYPTHRLTQHFLGLFNTCAINTNREALTMESRERGTPGEPPPPKVSTKRGPGRWRIVCSEAEAFGRAGSGSARVPWRNVMRRARSTLKKCLQSSSLKPFKIIF